MVIVSKYLVSRHYGGPQEGGWWFNRHELVGALRFPPLSEEGARTVCRHQNALAQLEREDDRRHQGRFSVAGGDDLVFMTENVKGEWDDSDKPWPHYE